MDIPSIAYGIAFLVPFATAIAIAVSSRRRQTTHYPRIHRAICEAIAAYNEYDQASSEHMRALLRETARDEATLIMRHLRNQGLMHFVLPASESKLCPHEREWDDCPECNH